MEEQKKLETQLRQSQKMESVGTLAGGIAHEFNNILNIIKGYTLLIRQSPSVNENVTENMNVIEETVERGAYGVRQLLTLARKTESCLALSNPNDLVSELSKLLKQTFPKTIDITLELDAKLPSIWVDPNQISQALLNVSVNARDALAGGGRLTLKTLLVEAGKVQDPAATAGPYACIEVKDTGSGMDAALRNRIFEPFFTTKGVGKGTGLGLAIVYGIVKNHNGFIDVDSEVGRGTSFRLYFPMARAEENPAVDEAPKREVSPPRRANGGATVLVVEDEEKMVYLLRKALLRNEYNVLVASDGEQAIDLYHRRKQDIAVVLLDIGLPKIAGLDVILRMKEENPNVKVIVASGYIDPDFKSRMQRAGVQGFIEKPYNPDAVVRMLCASLESSPRQLNASASDETPEL
jgi:CheY-like chemotaxis protein